MKLFTNEVMGEWHVDFSTRVGLNSGLVIVGSIGDDLRMDYTALGDTINLASRMESMAPPARFSSQSILSELARAFLHVQSP